MRAKFIKEMLESNLPNSAHPVHYPLHGLNYESSEGDNFMHNMTGDELECDVCGRRILPDKLENGLCKKCLDQEFWKDRQDNVHHGHTLEDDDIPKY